MPQLSPILWVGPFSHWWFVTLFYHNCLSHQSISTVKLCSSLNILNLLVVSSVLWSISTGRQGVVCRANSFALVMQHKTKKGTPYLVEQNRFGDRYPICIYIYIFIYVYTYIYIYLYTAIRIQHSIYNYSLKCKIVICKNSLQYISLFQGYTSL